MGTSQFLTSHTTRTTAGHHDNVHFHLFHLDGDHGQHAFHKLWSCSWVKNPSRTRCFTRGENATIRLGRACKEERPKIGKEETKVWKERPKVCQEEPEKVCKETGEEVQKERRSEVCKEEETRNEACNCKAEQDEWKTKHRL